MALQLKNGDATYYQSAEYCRNYTSPPVSYGDSSHYLNRLPGKERLATSSRWLTECANMREGWGVRGTWNRLPRFWCYHHRHHHHHHVRGALSINLFSLWMLHANMRLLRHYNGLSRCREAIFLIFQGSSMGWGRGLTVIWNSAVQRLLSSLEINPEVCCQNKGRNRVTSLLLLSVSAQLDLHSWWWQWQLHNKCFLFAPYWQQNGFHDVF